MKENLGEISHAVGQRSEGERSPEESIATEVAEWCHLSERLLLSSDAKLQKLLTHVDGHAPDGSTLRSAILDAVLSLSAAYTSLYRKHRALDERAWKEALER